MVINKAETRMVFLDVKSKLLVSAPSVLLQKLKPFFEKTQEPLHQINPNHTIEPFLTAHIWKYRRTG